MNVLFFANGNTAVLKDGEQVNELQESWLNLYCQFLESKGIDRVEIETASFFLVNGDKVKVFKTQYGDYNWKLE